MPELPDIAVYLECLEARCVGRVLEGIRISSPALLRSVDPPINAASGKRVEGLRRIGNSLSGSFQFKPLSRVLYFLDSRYCLTNYTKLCTTEVRTCF